MIETSQNYFNSDLRCACVNGGAKDVKDALEDLGGDLGNPQIKLYKNCAPKSASCKLPDDDDDE